MVSNCVQASVSVMSLKHGFGFVGSMERRIKLAINTLAMAHNKIDIKFMCIIFWVIMMCTNMMIYKSSKMFLKTNYVTTTSFLVENAKPVFVKLIY